MTFSPAHRLLLILSGLTALLSSAAGQAPVSPIWSYRYGVSEAELETDADGDGMKARQEAAFGTDPHAAASVLRVQATPLAPAGGMITWAGIPGIAYQLQRSADAVVWTDLGDVRAGAGARIEVDVAVGPDARFFRLRAAPSPDTDADGLNDYEEHLLHTAPTLADTDGDTVPDGQEYLSGRDPIRMDPVTRETGFHSITGSYALRADGSLWTVGINGAGTAGTGAPLTQVPMERFGQDADWLRLSSAEHMMAIKRDGSLWGWGRNSHGQLGLGRISSTPEPAPVRVGASADWAFVSAGGFGTVAIKTDGSLWEWGMLQYSTESNVPKRVGTESTWRMASSGNGHRLAVKQDGSLWAWGDNGRGQLGVGTASSSESSPRRVGLDTDWVDARASGESSVALKNNGTLWVWGSNRSGQLAVVSAEPDVTTPTQLGADTDWTLGGSTLSALRSDGTIWSWNTGLKPVLGDCRAFSGIMALRKDGSLWLLNQLSQARREEFASGSLQKSPRRFDTSFWRSVSLTAEGTAAIRADGTLWSWSAPNLGVSSNAANPRVQAGADTDWQAVAAGGFHALLLKIDRSLWGWGANDQGQAGTGSTTPQNHPLPVRVGTETDWDVIAAGGYRSYAIKASGSLWGWGSNAGGLGDGTSNPASQNTPIPIGAALWSTVAPRTFNNAGIQTDGSLWIWGLNTGGTGSESPATWTAPQRILPDAGWSQVAGGSRFWLAIRADGTLWGWGRNDIGQLGNGTPQPNLVLTPVRIGTDADWDFVVCRENYALAIKKDGSLWAWGNNDYGQLGDGTTTTRTTPARVGTDTDWITVSCGNVHVAALKRDGSLWTWGGKERLGISYPTGPLQIGEDRNWGR